MAEVVMAKIKSENRGGARKNAGRKPKETTKSAYFSTRLDAGTRDRLEREAKKSGLSLSNASQRRLNDSLIEKNAWGPPHVRDLARLAMHLALQVEGLTERPWTADRFTFEALKVAIELAMGKYAPKGDLVTPRIVEMSYEANRELFPAEVAEFHRTPAGVASATAL